MRAAPDAVRLAGLAVGYWAGQDDIARNWSLERRFESQMPAERRDELYGRWLKAVERARDWER